MSVQEARSAAKVRRDPRVRKDGLCAGADCRKPRRKHRVKSAGPSKRQPNATSMAKSLWLHELERDPWCSSRCCRRFHGVVYKSDGFTEEQTEARERAGRESAARFKAGVA